MYDVIIVGAGAAGLFLAAQFKGSGKKILLIEHNKVPGRKILVSGGGRANFTNLTVDFKSFHSSSKKFYKYALSDYKSEDFINYVRRHNIPFFEKKMGQLFCKNSAQDLLNALLKDCEEAGTEIVYNHEIKELNYDGHYQLDQFQGKSLVIASGGLSFSALGASDFGYRVAKQFSHKVTELRPALVGLHFPGFVELAGNSLIASVKIGRYMHSEDLLFTHKGFSGPLILKGSLFWNPGEKIVMDFLPGHRFIDEVYQFKNLDAYFKSKVSKSIKEFFVRRFNLDPKKNINEIAKKDLNKFNEFLHHFQFIPTGTDGYRRAEVTRGGIDTSEIDEQTMESKKQKGLYFIGEVLDVTGLLGGFNFQWAWSSAIVASRDLLLK